MAKARTMAPASAADAVRLDSVSKIFGHAERGVRALDGVSVRIRRGRFVAVMGPSGSGKSTFLHCAAGLDRPSSGAVFIGDTDLGGLSEKQLTHLRRERVGFVFQSFNLVPALTVAHNVDLPVRLAGERPRNSRVRDVLGRVGLPGYEARRPAQLSGGQQQRVAVARALITEPEVLFADEPTGALDTVTARGILDLLQSCSDGEGRTVVMVTHDPVAASFAGSVLFLADGRVVDEVAGASAGEIAERMTHLGAWAA